MDVALLVRDGVAQGVTLKNGEEYQARVVASNLDANLTFQKLLDPKILPPDFAEAISRALTCRKL